MVKNNLNKRIFTLNCQGRILIFDKPLVMGIINLTPDSFYGASRVNHPPELLHHFSKMLKDGADIIDIGGQSTRPGSERITEKEELLRVISPIELLKKEFPQAFISIDTFYSKVAAEAIAAGASMVNDTSCGSIDTKMLEVVGRLGVPYVCMHAPFAKHTLQQKSYYEDVTREVLDFFISKSEDCRLAGIMDVIIDPGFGFGKSIRHNLELLKNLAIFKMLDKPIMLGVSRKSTIYKSLNVSPEHALNGTTVLNTIGLLHGADILRVHDVKEAKEAVVLMQEYAGRTSSLETGE